MKHIGEEIARRRHAKGQSRVDLARKAGISVASLASIEVNRRRPSASILIRLSDALGLSVSERLGLFDLIGYGVTSSGSFTAGEAHSLVEQALGRIMVEREFTGAELAKALKMNAAELHEAVSQLVPAPALLQGVHRLGLREWEWDDLVSAWGQQAALSEPWNPVGAESSVELMALGLLGGARDRQELSESARAALLRMKAKLRLSDRDLAVMLDSTALEVSQWLNEGAPMPLFVIAKARKASSGLAVLEELFAPERLADVVRRPAALFDGRAAIDLIRNGEMRSVATKYDRALQYSL